MYINVVYCHSLVPIRWKNGRPLKLTFFPFDLGLRINNVLHYTELRELVTAAVSFRKNVTFFVFSLNFFVLGGLGHTLKTPLSIQRLLDFSFSVSTLSITGKVICYPFEIAICYPHIPNCSRQRVRIEFFV